MYLWDWCYLGTFILYFYINLMPQSEELFVICFLVSNGGLAAAIAAMRNSLVFHRMDFLGSLSIHSLPMILTNHIRWVTIPEQEHLPLDEQRFAPLAKVETWGDFGYLFFLNPFKVYLVWLIVFVAVNFVLPGSDKVRDYTLESTFKYFSKGFKAPKMISCIDKLPLEF